MNKKSGPCECEGRMTMSTARDIDGGWAWAVLVASYVNIFLASGLCYVAGMFQVVFLQQFQGSVALTSWITALFSSMMQLTGPLSSVVVNCTNCRVAVMIGGACFSLGMVISGFADSLEFLLVSFGILAGIGLGLTFTASIVVINYFFDRRRAMVTGVALSATGLGVGLAPQISTYLMDNMSWREALVALGALAAQSCIAGAIMFPLYERKNQQCAYLSDKVTGCLLCIDRSDCEETWSANKISSQHSMNVEIVVEKVTQDQCETNDDTVEQKPQFVWCSAPLWILCLQLFLANAGCASYNIHWPSFVKSKGFTDQEMTNIMSVNGAGCLFGRIIIGMLANALGCDLLLYWAVHIVAGVTLLFMPIYATTFASMTALVSIVGIYYGSSYAVLTTITIQYVGLSNLATAFGIEMISAGFGFLVAPPCAGLLVDMTGKFEYSIYCGGVLMILSSLALMLLPIVQPEGNRDSQQNTHSNIDLSMEAEDNEEGERKEENKKQEEENNTKRDDDVVERIERTNEEETDHVKKFREKERRRNR